MDSTILSTTKKVIKKRKYSRGGCKECKRRKIKCDEGKPFCHNCTRLNKVCGYPQSNNHVGSWNNSSKSLVQQQQEPPSHTQPSPCKFYLVNHSDIRTPTSSSRSLLQGSSMSSVDVNFGSGEFDPNTQQHQHQQQQQQQQEQQQQQQQQQQQPHQPHQLQHPPQQMLHLQRESQGPSPSDCKKYKISDVLSPEIDFLNDYNWGSIAPHEVQDLFGDANSLVHDSLEIFGINMDDDDDYGSFNRGGSGDGNYPPSVQSSEELSSIPEFPMRELSYKSESQPIINSGYISNKELIDSAFSGLDLAGPHEIYLNRLTETELGYHLFPFAHGIDANAVLKLLLKYSQGCPYLLAALLSSSATFQFIQNRKQVHEQNRSKYTSTCLKLLSEAFPKPNEKATTMANDIEKLLLTILILTSCFTAMAFFQKQSDSKMLSWKTHLRGVKDLLLKYTELTKSSSRAYISDGLALAKSWFFAIEALAELNDPLGGTLHYSKENISQVVDIIETDAEHDHSELSRIWLQTGYFSRERNAEYHDALLKINLLTAQYPNLVQFNLFNGYSINVVCIIDELTKCLDLLREHNNVQVSGFRVAKVMSLIAQGRDSFIVPLVDKSSFVIPIESIGHPKYHKLDRISFPASCYGKETLPDGRLVCYSWFDWSEQMQIESLALKVYITKGLLKLPRTHPIVKELKIRIISSMFFIKKKSQDVIRNYQDDIFLESDHYYVSKTLFDERALMAQSTFRQCLKVSLNEDDFEKLSLYFKALVKLGNGSALIGLEVVEKLWSKYKLKEDNERSRDGNGSELIESSDDDDDQTNMAFISFS
ncbi:Fungal specific transcription factor domain family protein [Candida parapsilosis]|uniref:Fungal specific transcription factor domain family protein n=1 Tax=Candida parapsilosis TaxID=5480 RepID=A0A8X7NHP2_CANPA|nr:Fungal specific transcription factor domain family protein [Candida parapsilosis]